MWKPLELMGSRNGMHPSCMHNPLEIAVVKDSHEMGELVQILIERL